MAKGEGYWPRVLRFLARHEAKIGVYESGRRDELHVQIKIPPRYDGFQPPCWMFTVDSQTLETDDVDRIAYEFLRGALRLQRTIEPEDNPGNTSPV